MALKLTAGICFWLSGVAAVLCLDALATRAEAWIVDATVALVLLIVGGATLRLLPRDALTRARLR